MSKYVPGDHVRLHEDSPIKIEGNPVGEITHAYTRESRISYQVIFPAPDREKWVQFQAYENELILERRRFEVGEKLERRPAFQLRGKFEIVGENPTHYEIAWVDMNDYGIEEKHTLWILHESMDRYFRPESEVETGHSQ